MRDRTEAPGAGRLSRTRPRALALAGYCLLSFLYFGLPVAAHPGRIVVGSENDPKVFIWMFAWWPHAIAHGDNPIYTHVIWAPSGYDLSWATSIPAIALVFSPLTALAGPVVAFNVAALLLPALSAWTAFLLCRYLTRTLWPSLLGGYLFGFTSYMLGHEEGHMNLAAVFLVPPIVLVIVRGVRGELDRRGVAWRFGLLIAAQILISTEVVATLTFALVAAAALAFGLVGAVRRSLLALVAPVVAGYGIAVAITSPFLYYIASNFKADPFTSPGEFVSDATNLVVPTRTIAMGGGGASHISAHFLGNELEQTAYLGVPLLLLLLLYFVTRRRDPSARFLFGSFALATIAAFGAGLHVSGHRVAWMPWSLVSRLPVFDNIYPVRFTLYATLVAAIVVALWASRSSVPLWIRVALPFLVIASLMPNVGKHRWDEKLDVPAFFAGSDVRRCIAPGENVLVLPYGYEGGSTVWQALSGFRFRMPGGEVGDEVPSSFNVGTVDALRFGGVPPGGGQEILDFAQGKDVSTILVDPADAVPWAALLTSVGPPKEVGGVLLYRIAGNKAAYPGC